MNLQKHFDKALYLARKREDIKEAIRNFESYKQAGSPQLTFNDETYWEKEKQKSIMELNEVTYKYNSLLERLKIR